MFPFSIADVFLGMAACLFLMGIVCIGTGVVIMVSRIMGDEVRVIAQQTAKLAQKGIAEDVSGLVGNASALLEAVNQLTKTASGVGVFLILAGFILAAASYFIVLQIR